MATNNRITLLLTLFTFFFSQFAVSANNDQINNIWQIVYVEGLAQTKTIDGASTDKGWRSLSLGENLPAPVYLRTGQDSRIILKHRKDKITIASSSLLRLEKEKYTEDGILTKIIQSIGYSLFNIEKNSGRKNIIETPYLVSVVKGTTFSVQVSKNRAIVNLIEGRLQVDAKNINHSTIINTGQIAQLARGDNAISVLDVSSQVSPNTIINKQVTKTIPRVITNETPVVSDASTTAMDITTPTANSTPGFSGTTTVPATINSAVKDSILISNGVTDIILPGNNGVMGTGNTNSGNKGNKGNKGNNGRN